MQDCGATVEKKKALVISDDDRLARAIVLILDSCLDTDTIELEPEPPQQWKRHEGEADLDLIVLVQSSAHSEPIVILARASMGGRLGQVPILILSERPFSSKPAENIFYIDFYDPHKLCARALEILNKHPANPEPGGALN